MIENKKVLYGTLETCRHLLGNQQKEIKMNLRSVHHTFLTPKIETSQTNTLFTIIYSIFYTESDSVNNSYHLGVFS